jgi:hypothetical protein
VKAQSEENGQKIKEKLRVSLHKLNKQNVPHLKKERERKSEESEECEGTEWGKWTEDKREKEKKGLMLQANEIFRAWKKKNGAKDRRKRRESRKQMTYAVVWMHKVKISATARRLWKGNQWGKRQQIERWEWVLK